MSFLRPAARAALGRWGGPAALGAATAAMLWLGVGAWRQGSWLAAVFLVLAGLGAVALCGLAEGLLLRRRARRDGPGIVTLEEGRISYFAPHGGAILARDALVGIDLATTDAGGDGLTWELTDETGRFVAIPGGAEGADGLIDALGTLPGFDHAAALRAARAPGATRRTVWRRPAARLG